MRSPNKRSRSKSNRPKSLGNIVNRVFDSSGPEGKVRGTPQQIIEKYQVLARDAQLSNDRVAAENFQQHAEHYTRMLAQAQREMQAEQEARRQQQEDRNRHLQEERANANQRRQDNRRSDDEPAPQQQPARQEAEPARAATSHDSFSVQDVSDGTENGVLVETPESSASLSTEAEPEQTPKPKPANRRKPRPRREDDQPATGDGDTAPQGEGVVQSDKPKPRRAPRKRKTDEGQPELPDMKQSAAE